MTDVVQEAAAALMPVLAAGGSEAIKLVGEDMGGDFYKAAKRIALKLRDLLANKQADQATIETAIRSALNQGKLQEEDLRTLVALRGGGDCITISNQTVKAKHNIFQGNSITVHGDFNT